MLQDPRCIEDPFGHHSSVATHVRDVSPEEMREATRSPLSPLSLRITSRADLSRLPRDCAVVGAALSRFCFVAIGAGTSDVSLVRGL
jgi:hypothetical protein